MVRVSRFVVHSSAEKGEDFLEKAGDFRRKVPCFFQFRLSLRKWEQMRGRTAVGESRQPVGRTEEKEQKMRRERRHREGAEDMHPSPSDKKIPALTKRAGMGNLVCVSSEKQPSCGYSIICCGERANTSSLGSTICQRARRSLWVLRRGRGRDRDAKCAMRAKSWLAYRRRRRCGAAGGA